MNIMTIADQKAVIAYDPEIDMFRGEFLGLSGGADFYATDIEGLHREGEISLRVYLEACEKSGREPYRHFSGKFNVRIDPRLHEAVVIAAGSKGQSLNQFVAEAIQKQTSAS